MGFLKAHKKKRPVPTPARPSSPAPQRLEESESESESESEEQLQTLADRPTGNVQLGRGRVETADESGESAEQESSESGAPSNESGEGDSAPPTAAEVQKATQKVKKAGYGQTRSLDQMSRAIRDTMSYDDIKHARSRNTTLYRLMVALDELSATKHQDLQLPIVKRVGRLAEQYKHRHRNSVRDDDRTRVALMEDIDQLASVHILRTHAQLKYVEEMQRSSREGEDEEPEAPPLAPGKAPKAAKASKFEFLTGGLGIRHNANVWAAAPEDPRFLAGPDSWTDATGRIRKADPRNVVQSAGLSHAEVLAIRTYTADNFRYMNPAVTNFDRGLSNYLQETGKDSLVDDETSESEGDEGLVIGKKSELKAKQRLKLEGAAHAGVAMAGLAKLPGWRGTTYRGDNVDLGRLQKLYTLRRLNTNEMFLSTSKTTDTATTFLTQHDNGPIQLMVEIEIAGSGGKDISRISTASQEDEVLLVPGAKYVTLSIEEYDVVSKTRSPLTGKPSARRRADGRVPAYYVRIRQTD